MSKESELLSPRQITFCELIVKPGADVMHSMIEAGYAESTARAKGKWLMSQDKIQQRIKEIKLSQPHIREALITRQENLQGLIHLAEDDTSPAATKVKARDSINKMMGWNEPEKVDIIHSFQTDLETQIRMAERLIVEQGGKVSWPKAKVVKGTK